MIKSVTVSRVDAVRELAAVIRDQQHYIIAIAPESIDTALRLLDGIDTAHCYLDNGGSLTLIGPCVLARAAASAWPLPTCVVVTIPKTPDHADELTARHIPIEPHEVLLANWECIPAVWPLLFVDALALVDPAAASIIGSQIPAPRPSTPDS